jgi:hypothetical protein
LESQQIEAELRRELATIYAEVWGTRIAHLRVLVDDDVIFCLLDELELLPAEEILVDSGKADAVVAARVTYREAIEATFHAAVERATGRNVVSSLSTVRVHDPVFAVDVFRLMPER